jgi:hypothetical protein
MHNRDDGKRFVVHADEKLAAFMELKWRFAWRRAGALLCKVLAGGQQSSYKPVVQPRPPHGRGKRRFSTRPPAPIFHLTTSLLLAFAASCEKTTQPIHKPPTEPTRPPLVSLMKKEDLNKERTELKTWRTKIEEARKSNLIKESEYEANIRKYEERVRQNEADLKKLNPGN